MSLPAKQTKDVNFIVDDPERLLDVHKLATNEKRPPVPAAVNS